MVSVIVPSFKMGQFIGEALESVGAQTYRNWEVIVVDDAGPEDGTRATVVAFAANHPDHRVEYIRHEANRGVSVSRKTAFEASRGEFIAFLDADDRFMPEKLQEHVSSLESHPECVLVHGPVVDENSTGAVLVPDLRYFYHGDKSCQYYHRKKHKFLGHSRICNSTMTCKRKYIQNTDFPLRTTFQNEDKLLWMLLSGRGAFFYNKNPLTAYRWHSGGYSEIYKQKPGLFLFSEIEFLAHLLIRTKNPFLIYQIGRHMSELLIGIMWWCGEGEPSLRKHLTLKSRFAFFCGSLFGKQK